MLYYRTPRHHFSSLLLPTRPTFAPLPLLNWIAGLAGVVFADSGYVSAQIKQDLMDKDVAFIAKPTAAMADMRWYFDRNWARLYK